jgi:hypothetical protein
VTVSAESWFEVQLEGAELAALEADLAQRLWMVAAGQQALLDEFEGKSLSVQERRMLEILVAASERLFETLSEGL